MEVTYGLMIAIGLITYVAWQRPQLHKALILNPYQVAKRKHYPRLLTSGFVHNSSMHLFLNLFTLYFFGGAIEEIFQVFFGTFGLYLYIILFCTAVIVANIHTTWITTATCKCHCQLPLATVDWQSPMVCNCEWQMPIAVAYGACRWQVPAVAIRNCQR